LATTTSDCGACGHACATDQVCKAGTCRDTDPALVGLKASIGTLTPAFDPAITSYRLTVPPFTTSLRLTPTAASPEASISVDGQPVASGDPSPELARPNLSGTPMYVRVTAQDGITLRGYRVLPVWRDTEVVEASLRSSARCFGQAIAASDDTLVVGEPCPVLPDPPDAGAPDGGAPDAGPVDAGAPDAGVVPGGAVAVFRRTDAGWVREGDLDPGGLQGYLPEDLPGPLASYGRAVAISGDTAVVGAPFEAPHDLPGPSGFPIDSGGVTVFVRVDGGWKKQAHLVPATRVSGEQFGAAVALFGDLLVVGAPADSSSATGIDGDPADQRAPASGAAYVFARRGTVWDQQAYLKASNTGAGDGFGTSVAASLDLVAIGAPGEASGAVGIDGDQASNTAPGSGAAYVFTRASGAWTQTAYLKAANADARDAFGTAVALRGSALAVGAPGEASAATGVDGDPLDNEVPNSGAAYVFGLASFGWFQAAYVKAGNPHHQWDAFGTTVAFAGPHLAVGAPGEHSAEVGVVGHAPSTGKAVFGAGYSFVLSGMQWQERGWVKSPDLMGTAGPAIAVTSDGVVLIEGSTRDRDGVVFGF
jgi:hypothetical protein